MAKYAQWITHKGKRLLFVNCAGLREAEYLLALDELKQAILKENAPSSVLFDLTRTQVTSAALGKAKEVTAAIKAAGIPYERHAVVGMSEVMKSAVSLTARSIHFADTIEEGKEWLVKEAGK